MAQGSITEGAIQTDKAMFGGIAKLCKFFTLNVAAANPDGALSQHIQNYNKLKGGETLGNQLDATIKGMKGGPGA